MVRRGQKRSGRCTRRNKQTAGPDIEEPKELQNAPHSFVLHRGKVGPYVRELVRDFRRVMEPFTASSLKTTKKNVLKDFVSVAGLFHVTHSCIFTRTDLGAYLKIARLPRGPTLSLRVHNYTLARDVLSSLKKQMVFGRQLDHPPLIVLNGFSGEGKHIHLLTTTFQNMFPTINLVKVQLSNVRRCVLLNYDPATKLIDFRHFAIKVVPVGISKSVKKIVQSKVPDLGRYQDVAQYLTNPTQLSESEAEDDPASHVVLPQQLSSRGNMASNASAIRVVELGPRLTLELLKVESNFLTGDVLYHSYIEKSKEEIKLIKKKVEEKRHLKQERKKFQQENTIKKEQKKQLLKERSLEGMKKKYGKKIGDKADSNQHSRNDGDDAADDDEDDDAEWYRKEVGQEPERDLFNTGTNDSIKRKKPLLSPVVRRKKIKVEKSGVVKNPQKSKQFVGRSESGKKVEKKKVITSMQHKRPKHKNR